jgi:hypothetical protein
MPSQTLKDIAVWAWRSTRLFAFVLVVIAVVVGAHLRFHRLARFDMSGDEGASWAAASAPSVQQTADMERRLDPGKLALYDVMLHEWIAAFGDSLFVMRAMSAALGTIAMVLVFVAVREIRSSLVIDEPAAAGVSELAGAFAALLYAANLEMVLSDRTVRMYPLVMCAELLQITFFVRAQPEGRNVKLYRHRDFYSFNDRQQLYVVVSHSGGGVVARLVAARDAVECAVATAGSVPSRLRIGRRICDADTLAARRSCLFAAVGGVARLDQTAAHFVAVYNTTQLDW